MFTFTSGLEIFELAALELTFSSELLATEFVELLSGDLDEELFKLFSLLSSPPSLELEELVC